MSGGERNRVHLARMLQSGGNLILLDEPTNDLDVETLRTLEEALEGFGGCVIAISHDRWFLNQWLHTSWLLKVIPTLCGLKVRTMNMRQTVNADMVKMLIPQNVLNTSHWHDSSYSDCSIS